MPRGGRRVPGIDPVTGERKKLGRPKSTRATDAKVAANVLKKQKSETLWNEIVETDIKIMRDKQETRPLRDDLHYLEDRALGLPARAVVLQGPHGEAGSPIPVNLSGDTLERLISVVGALRHRHSKSSPKP